jgi:hypothetical protein
MKLIFTESRAQTIPSEVSLHDAVNAVVSKQLYQLLGIFGSTTRGVEENPALRL